MHALDMPADEAEDALVRLAAVVPADVELGRPWTASRDPDGSVQFLTGENVAVALWTLLPDGSVERILQVSAGKFEVVTWSRGIETSRRLARAGG